MVIQRRLIERNVRSHQPLSCLPLPPVHCRARLQRCLARSGWNHADRGRRVFSDESLFKLCPDDHRRRVWKRSGRCADPTFNITRHAGFQLGVLVRGAISFNSRNLWSSHLQHSGMSKIF
ncbi:uncharacterized protein TNCV_3633571 [Trichonephila clavipes]|nr:uncharacterized protein TNCV_3633571 [Trichonephila clavipes]